MRLYVDWRQGRLFHRFQNLAVGMRMSFATMSCLQVEMQRSLGLVIEYIADFDARLQKKLWFLVLLKRIVWGRECCR